VLLSVEASGNAGSPPMDLRPGPLFWRVWGRQGPVESSRASAVWGFEGARTTDTVETVQRGSVDINGDALADVVVGNTERHEIAVYLGSAGAIASPLTLQDPLLFAGGFTLRRAGDVNGDGRTDLVVSTSLVSWRVYYGSTNGFRAEFASILGVTPSSDQRASLNAVGDVNGDGFSDLAYLVYQQGSLLGSCSLYFGSATGISNTPSATLESTRVLSLGAVGDLDADGFEDMGAIGAVLPGETAPYLFAFAGVPGGVSQRTLRGSVSMLGASAQLSARADVDGDGRFDVLLGDDFARSAHALVLGARGGFAQQFTSRATPDGSSTRDVSLTDLNADGRADLVMANSDGRQLIAYRGSPTGLAPDVGDRLVLPSSLSPPGMASPGDVNGDGFQDLAVLLNDNGRILLHLVRGGPSMAIDLRPFDSVVVASASVLRPLE
jgi:hypothetical protein